MHIGWRITVELLFPQRTGALREPLCVPYQSSELSIIPLHETEKNTVDGCPSKSCSHREQGIWEEPFCVTYQSSQLYIVALQEAESGLYNSSLSFTLLAYVMARRTRMVGWRWRFNDDGFKHIAYKSEHISKYSVLALSSGGWSLKQQPWFLVSLTYVANALYNR